jgi:DNA-binding NarL/FixJ family response regulator
MAPISIAFVDDHPTLLKGMAALFSADERYRIVGTGLSADAALALTLEHRPDILILDLSMPGDVFSAIAGIVERVSGTKIVIFTAFANVDMAMKSLDAGAHAFVLKGRPSEDLYEAIDAVMQGQLFVSPGFSQTLMSGFRNRSKREQELASARLSTRERQIVHCLFEAKTNKEIARTLDLSEKTVKHYMTNLMSKLKVKNRLEAVLAAQALRTEGDQLLEEVGEATDKERS